MTTKTQRKAVYEVLARSAVYDPKTMQISRTGFVSARKDPNKTYRNTHDRKSYLIGLVQDLVTPAGEIREGY